MPKYNDFDLDLQENKVMKMEQSAFYSRGYEHTCEGCPEDSTDCGYSRYYNCN